MEQAHRQTLGRRWLALVATVAWLSLGGAETRMSGGRGSLLEVVRRYADTLVERGRDTYGPMKTGLLLSALDRSQLGPLTTRPTGPEGSREGDRAGPRNGPLVGANPQHDQEVLRTFYVLSSLKGESSRYREAADQEITWFFRNARSPQTDLLAWGEHLSWDVMKDEVASGMITPVHEFAGPWPFWDRCFELVPEETKRFALGLWNHQIADQKQGSFDRHARFWEHKPQEGMEFARHAGFFISTWAHAYAHTQDKTFLEAIAAVLGRVEKRRHPQTGLIDQCCRRKFSVMSQTLSMAIDCDAAAGCVPEPLASRLRAFAAREDEVFCSLPHEPRDKGFLNVVERSTAKPMKMPGANPEPPYTPAWESHYGGIPSAPVAVMCGHRYDQGHYAKYPELIVAAADSYMAPPPGDVDLKPGTFAAVIMTELNAFRLSHKEAYLKRAEELAWQAVDLFWQGHPLPRASSTTQQYESMSGSGGLAIALLQVHAATSQGATSIPIDSMGR